VKQLRIIIIVFILVTTGVFFWVTSGTSAESLLFEHLGMTDQHLVLVILLISAFILLSTLSGLPLLYLMVAIGFLLKFIPALLICVAVNLLAVMGTFYMVRYAFKDYFRGKYGKKKLIRRINKRIKKYGLWTVAFSRAVYIIPTSLINYSIPLSHISVRTYFFGTLIGLVPECAINVTTGYLIKHGVILLSSPDRHLWQGLAIGGTVLVSILAFVLLRIRQNRIRKFRRLKAIPYSNPAGPAPVHHLQDN
jgi:uncharacterized membrane protein YdjX (TVP38/TMEM64 family)